ncbi:MAG: Gfo/Idh/MocA family protein [Treponemataceae bacterium]
MLKLGIIAAGSIVQDFMNDLHFVKDIKVVALYSRTFEKSQQTCQKFDIPICCRTLEEIFEYCEAVYIASPNSVHFEQIKLSLEKGKHVLCEKPICLNQADYLQLRDLATKKNLVLMEAQRMTTMKSFLAVKALIDNGDLGEVILFEASTGIAGQRLDRRTKALGGGALMDLGVYPLFAFTFLFGKPESVNAFGHFYTTGVDDYTSVQVKKGSTIGHLSSSFSVNTRGGLYIAGTKASVFIPNVFSSSQEFTVREYNKEEKTVQCPQDGLGLAAMTSQFYEYTQNKNA